MEASLLTSKGQLLIPKRIRNKYGMKPGVKVVFEETAEGIVLKPMNENYFKSFRGILKSTGNLKEEMKEMKEDEKKHEERKFNKLPGANKKTK